MTKKYKKFNFLGINKIFLCAIFFYLLANKVLATEITYPTLSGINPSSNPSLPSFVKYLFLFGTFLGFFAVFASLVVAGAMWFLSSVNGGLLAKAKDRVYGSMAGLLILFLLYLIVTTLSPSLGVFNTNSLPSVSPYPSPNSTQPSGVYFYNSNNCSTTGSSQPQYDNSNVADFGAFKNNISSVETVQDPNTMYATVLYDTVNLEGKCQIISPTNKIQSCQNETSPFANSAAIFKYNPAPTGDGVYFYRKDCFNTPIQNLNCGAGANTNICQCSTAECLASECNANGGGYYEITNSDILDSIKNGNAGYMASLDSLKFTGTSNSTNCTANCTVPKNDQDCTSYDVNGKCTQRCCPSLGGQNISSVVINGDYIVLFIYKDSNDASGGPWTYCQAFPAANDINGIGPLKLNWQTIRNTRNQI